MHVAAAADAAYNREGSMYAADREGSDREEKVSYISHTRGILLLLLLLLLLLPLLLYLLLHLLQ